MTSVTQYKFSRNKFPSSFKFGVGSAAYQVEGAWNEDGKTESTWDYHTHTFPHRFANKETCEIACDSYHNIDEDVANLKSLNVDFYRLSFSWSRILPTGFSSVVNPDGVSYYRKLIRALFSNQISAVVTLCHGDLPQCLEAIGGWTNPLVVDYFVNYARVCFNEFGEFVKIWISFDSPNYVAAFGYGDCKQAPFMDLDGIGSYLAAHHMLLAHGLVYRMYNREFLTQQGSFGIAIDCPWFEAYSSIKDDVDAANRMLEMYIGWIANPIFTEEGNYPKIMQERIDANSEAQGYPISRLPKFSESQTEMLRGAADFFGVHHWSAYYVTHANIGVIPSNDNDIGAHNFVDEAWRQTARPQQRVLPWGVFNILHWITDRYARPLIFITGNGYPGQADEDEFNDSERINYITDYLKEIARAMFEYNCDISAYTYFPFMDCFEGTDAYSIRSGLYRVDFESPKRTRTAKRSAHIYEFIAKTHSIYPEFTDNGTHMDVKLASITEASTSQYEAKDADD